MSEPAAAERWRVGAGSRVDLNRIDPADPAGAPGGKRPTRQATAELAGRLASLHDRLWAEADRSVLLVLQALDAGGKDGTVKHVVGAVNPMGVRTAAFRAPSETERAHDFLWRISARLPERGQLGVFNRSHYEDVLVARVAGIVPEDVWRPRYESIRHFEEHLVREGTSVVKVFLHISAGEQAERLQARLDDPTKRWKFRLGDLEVRERWDDYRSAYEDALLETSTEAAPWHVVPADRKWYRNWAVSTILVDVLERLGPTYPDAPEDLSDVTIV